MSASVTITRQLVKPGCFNKELELPFSLRLSDFDAAMQDIYDFLHDVNVALSSRGLQRMDDILRPAAMSGIISDMLTASLAKHSRALVENRFHNGHPDLLVKGRYPDDAAKSGVEGVEIKSTRNRGGAVDTHGARDQWMCVFVYEVDTDSEPAISRRPMHFVEVYLAQVIEADFRKNARGDLGTRTATLHKDGVLKLRQGMVYRDQA